MRQRLGLERDYEAHIFRRGTHFFHLENWYSIHGLIRALLRMAGLHTRGRRNALAIELRHNDVLLANLPREFDGFTLLQLSDLHLDMNLIFPAALIERVQGLDYDLCVMTGDYRARTFGPIAATLERLRELRQHLKGAVYCVLGNHDTIRLVPPMEAMGYALLLNEWTRIERDGAVIYLAGIEDAHFYRMENFHRAAHDIPPAAVSILLSHTPEAYRHAAHAGFDLMLSGHTHGGQICLPGGVPIVTDADSPRAFARGAWRYHDMVGYTSVGAGTCIVDVRLNCLPEITLHHFKRLPPKQLPTSRSAQ
ncbi:metallophosphoesterase (plasmid) [Bosea sp. F3-2]|uniref:metallophosphoesterase n=1 Tax=Bosea sp. F3-2 TaxID=2599640 RepID=UPI0011F06EFE|nr:metallophosphoesterase [Bosea sp. F3-2]QEL27174.1 metallophosphoesterase [Bosea sp. F3-2]